MDYMILLNLIFSLTIVALGIKRYIQSGRVRAFLLIGLAYVLFGFSHFALLMGWSGLKAVLSGVRAAGYVMVIVGLVI